MNCINEDTINRLLDFDLTEEEMDAISAHLEECDTCLGKVMDAVVSDKELITRLTGTDRTAQQRPRRGGCLNKKLLIGYVADCLNAADKQHVESHLGNCNLCVGHMMELQKNSLKDSEIAFDTKSLAAELRAGEKDRVLFIPLVVDFGRRIIEVIKDQCNGIVIGGQLAPVGVRGGRAIASEGVHIQKNFSDKGISVEVAVSVGNKPDTCDIRLSLMGMKGDEVIGIMESTKVNISGMGVDRNAVTDKRGEVEFTELTYGMYRIKAVDSGVETDVSIEKNVEIVETY